ncbi:MAG: electron transfer flavoprotein subunit beta/FixA family protein [Acidimicrobiia bacterium]|nr:MAG: electron transfer flavoprotein subunit beta/FixA family protein [Acidimicrobiia bacterium]
MNIAVLLRAVPDPVEELEIDGVDLDRDFLGYVLNEFDDHALEEGLLIKEETGGTVTVYALGTADEVEQMLHTALAKGADTAKMLGSDLDVVDAHGQAETFVEALTGGGFDLVLSGVQASDEIDGQVAMLVAAGLGFPHVSVVVGTKPADGSIRVTKEYWAGITADYDVALPAVLGIQTAREAPRYVAVARIRQAQESGNLEELDIDQPENGSRMTITEMRLPEEGEGAEMIEGDEEAAVDRVLELLQAAGVR